MRHFFLPKTLGVYHLKIKLAISFSFGYTYIIKERTK